ncbi:(2Fe-2S)-binding protein [Halalkalibacter oceani]|uniref:(2Fe-2S)-binding protein n=1 Tax=Halalkalibacter oceani TaxID=1653776 RepID=UPI003390E51A
MTSGETVQLKLNGQQQTWHGSPTKPLVDYIREEAGLTGTKIGCKTGECGACMVLLDGKPVVSCILPTAAVQGAHVETIEGIKQHDIFQRLTDSMIVHGGVQCGFCTPGIMMTVTAYVNAPAPFNGNVAQALKNNLCRCTGYRGIIQAVEKIEKEESDREQHV